MGSKNQKPKNRDSETKVKNRGQKIVIKPTLNHSKATQILEKANAHGLQVSYNKIILQSAKSLTHLRKLIGICTAEQGENKNAKT